ncbi:MULTISPECIES: helix-turn-helix domain-containing protein [Metallosphaera]|uniref:Transcriptional regulator, HxlR family n=3 Tax=Metallosphaera TaxID=41980 RepID=A4YDE0_METS5|nr:MULTISPECIES: helix-turn-helix domain-containing protein [Metallosphaera]ABP94442.1 transcriptional regulator, HxlR family [Metallosphaera sedula DSM 5348]AIM26429.1 transcriptional regulator, HxlR family [Metallosphaera sedula]AKV73430.1 HxlR family transcriptional regulator [Metallosphaera sedula]AKV75673.1 HxlR family transcriptional regulator [Metallosphaera sedula]AKV77919.1 HxlR family transcriptional regulator [Metallosphaera sedula]
MASISRDEQNKTTCPIVETIKIIGTEARLLVLRYLFDGPKGFNQLLRETGLSSKTLSSTLKFMEEAGIVERRIVGTRPFKVEYALTSKGKELESIFKLMGQWGEKWVLNKN